MVLILLVSISIISALLSRLVPRWDALLAWLLGMLLAICAGLYTEGFDHEQYVLMIENTKLLTDQDILVQLYAAKDPLFLLIIKLSVALTDNIQLVFLIVATLASVTKVLATSALKGRRTLFMALYVIFISPGLEFAAIRAGLAVGLTMLGYFAVQRLPWKILWVVLGVLSHISVLIITAGRIWVSRWYTMLIGTVFIIPAITLFLPSLIEEDDRYSHYLANGGTLLAFGLPVVTLLCLLLLILSLKSKQTVQHPVLTQNWLLTSFFIMGGVFVLTIPVVTIATRLMEIGWVLLLFQIVAKDSQVDKKSVGVRVFLLAAMISLLSVANLLRGTWAVLI